MFILLFLLFPICISKKICVFFQEPSDVEWFCFQKNDRIWSLNVLLFSFSFCFFGYSRGYESEKARGQDGRGVRRILGYLRRPGFIPWRLTSLLMGRWGVWRASRAEKVSSSCNLGRALRVVATPRSLRMDATSPPKTTALHAPAKAGRATSSPTQIVVNVTGMRQIRGTIQLILSPFPPGIHQPFNLNNHIQYTIYIFWDVRSISISHPFPHSFSHSLTNVNLRLSRHLVHVVCNASLAQSTCFTTQGGGRLD